MSKLTAKSLIIPNSRGPNSSAHSVLALADLVGAADDLGGKPFPRRRHISRRLCSSGAGHGSMGTPAGALNRFIDFADQSAPLQFHDVPGANAHSHLVCAGT